MPDISISRAVEVAGRMKPSASNIQAIEEARRKRGLEPLKRRARRSKRNFGTLPFLALVAIFSSFIGYRVATTPTAAHAITYYPRCSTAHAIGVHSIRKGEPGSRAGLDADDDGIACEPLP